MSYMSKLQNVEEAIISKCREKITEKFNKTYFEIWMSIDAPCDFPEIYEKEFRNEFGDIIDETTSLYTQSCGSNLYYHIDTITTIQENIILSGILQYVELFIKLQLNDFLEAFKHLQIAMPGDIKGAIEETNPSNT